MDRFEVGLSDAEAARIPADYLSLTIDTSLVLGGHWWGAEKGTRGGLALERALPIDLRSPRLAAYAKLMAPAMLRIGGTEADRVGYRVGKKRGSTLGTGRSGSRHQEKALEAHQRLRRRGGLRHPLRRERRALRSRAIGLLEPRLRPKAHRLYREEGPSGARLGARQRGERLPLHARNKKSRQPLPVRRGLRSLLPARSRASPGRLGRRPGIVRVARHRRAESDNPRPWEKAPRWRRPMS